MYDIVQFRSHDIKFPISRKLLFPGNPRKTSSGEYSCVSHLEPSERKMKTQLIRFVFLRMSVSTTLFHRLSITNSFDHQGVGGLLLRRWRCRCSGKIVAVTSGRLKVFPPIHAYFFRPAKIPAKCRHFCIRPKKICPEVSAPLFRGFVA